MEHHNLNASLSLCEAPDEARDVGSFARAALDLRKMGLAPIPCGKEDGKKPLIARWQEGKLSFASLRKLASQYGSANVGIVCGPSKLVVVDIDNPSLLDVMLERFGQTPLIVQTPKRGYHLYYKQGNQEVRATKLQPEFAVDIQAGARFVVVPPSRNPETGKPYRFYRGDWSCLPELPEFRVEALPARVRRPVSSTTRHAPTEVSNEGERNNKLFFFCLGIAPEIKTFEELIAGAKAFNFENNRPPLPDKEVRSTAGKVWDYKCRGRIWKGSSGWVYVSKELALKLANKNALALLVLLWCEHVARNEPFPVCRRAMAEAECIPGWTEHQYREALRVLREAGVLEIVNKGGKGPNDPSLYRFSSWVLHNIGRRSLYKGVCFFGLPSDLEEMKVPVYILQTEEVSKIHFGFRSNKWDVVVAIDGSQIG